MQSFIFIYVLLRFYIYTVQGLNYRNLKDEKNCSYIGRGYIYILIIWSHFSTIKYWHYPGPIYNCTNTEKGTKSHYTEMPSPPHPFNLLIKSSLLTLHNNYNLHCYHCCHSPNSFACCSDPDDIFTARRLCQNLPVELQFRLYLLRKHLLLHTHWVAIEIFTLFLSYPKTHLLDAESRIHNVCRNSSIWIRCALYFLVTNTLWIW